MASSFSSLSGSLSNRGRDKERNRGDRGKLLSYFTEKVPLQDYPIVSYPILSYRIVSYPILSYRILSYRIVYRISHQIPYPKLQQTNFCILSYFYVSYICREKFNCSACNKPKLVLSVQRKVSISFKSIDTFHNMLCSKRDM